MTLCLNNLIEIKIILKNKSLQCMKIVLESFNKKNNSVMVK